MANGTDTSTTPAPAPALPAGGLDSATLQQLQGLTQGLLAPPPTIGPDTTPADRSWTSILGEALSGGPQTGAMSQQQRENAGNRALMGFGTALMAASRYQPGQTLWSNLAEGFQGARQSELGSEQMAAGMLGARQQYQLAQREQQIAGLKEAIPLLTLQQQAAAVASARGQGGAPPAGGAAPSTSVAPSGTVAPFSSGQADFVTKFTPIAQKIAQQTGLPLDYVMGQAGLETGWGTSAAAGHNNFFGISPGGKLASYDTPEAGAQAYIDLMASKRYADVPRTGTPQQIGDAMATAGYNPSKPGVGPDGKPLTDTYGARIGNFAAQLAAHRAATAAATGAAGAAGAPAPAPAKFAGPGAPTAPATGAPTPTPAPEGGIPAGIGAAARAGAAGAPAPPSISQAMADASAKAIATNQDVPIPGGGGLVAKAGTGNVGSPEGGLGAAQAAAAAAAGLPTGVAGAARAGAAGVPAVAPAPPPAGAPPGPAPAAPAAVPPPGAAPAVAPPAVAAPGVVPAPGAAVPPTPAPAPAAPQYPPIKVPSGGSVTHPGDWPTYRAANMPKPDTTQEIYNPNLSADTLQGFAARQHGIDQEEAFLQSPAGYAQAPALRQKIIAEQTQLNTDMANARQAKRQVASDATANFQKDQEPGLRTAYDTAVKSYTDAAHTLVQSGATTAEQDAAARLDAAKTQYANITKGADDARSKVAQLDVLQALSNAAGSADPIGQIKFGDQTFAQILSNWGLGTQDQLNKLSAEQALSLAASKMGMDLRSGQGMGRLTNQELTFVQNMVPNPGQRPDQRNAMIAYLRTLYQRQLDYSTAVGRYWSVPGTSMADAMDRAEKDLGPTLQTAPAELNARDPAHPTPQETAAQYAWLRKSGVQPGTFYKKSDGSLGIAPQRYPPLPGQ